MRLTFLVLCKMSWQHFNLLAWPVVQTSMLLKRTSDAIAFYFYTKSCQSVPVEYITNRTDLYIQDGLDYD